MQLKVLLIVCIFERAFSTCPHERSLKKWSESSTWGTSGKPTEGQSVEISEGILLDESPPDLYNITILSTGSLVFDPTADLKLRVANIYVYGSFEIGSEECTYDGQLTITLTGNRESHAGEKESKVILVNAGGTIEIHGPPKLSWTKLDTTLIANHENENMLFEHKRNDTYLQVREENIGVSAYTVIIEDNKPVIKQYGMYDIVTHGLELVEQIEDLQEGEILMMASMRRIRNPGNTKTAPKVYNAFETLLYGEATEESILRYVDNVGSTWAFVYQKGNPNSYAESTHPQGYDSYARFRADGGLIFSAEAYGHKLVSAQANNFRIGTIDDIFPKLDLVDDATTWLPGDRIAIASTDYDWEQAEEAELILCTDCAPNEVRIDAVVKYRHFGEIVSESVDMRAEVAMLSRTVVIEGEMEAGCPTYNGNCDSPKIKDIDSFGAHIKILKDYNNSRIENIELRNVGQQTDLGRYPVHWHMTFDKKESSAIPYARGLSIHDTFARCVTIHGTHGVRVENNACYNHMGHGYFLEDGGEKDNVFDGNLAMTARRGTGDLESTDSRPTGFWITNPKNYISNNVAAGGEGTGIWMIFPNQPLGPSSKYNLMTFDEARRTNCPLFYNNVAHSNNVMGIHIGQTLLDDRTFDCCNKWQPLEDPNDLTSNPVPITLDKITGYKNKNFNVWLEGGLLEITRVSVADSANSLLVSNDGMLSKYAGRCSQSVVIGESINKGVPTPGFDRSLPDHRYTDQVQSGVTTWKGPAHFSNMWFDSFQTNSNYDIVGIAKKRDSPYFHPMLTSFTDILFAFDDGAGLGTYTLSGSPTDTGWTGSKDGELMSGFTLYQEIPGRPADHFYVVKPDAFSAAASDCILRPNWKLAICETKYGNLRIASKTKYNPIVFVRDDIPSAQIEFEMESNVGPEVVLDGTRTYTVHFKEEIGTWIKFIAPGLDKGDTLRIGVCLPLDAEWEIKAIHPHRVSKKSRFTEVDSLSELDEEDSELDGKKYYFDESSGMVYYKYVNTLERSVNETGGCPGGQCSEFQLRVKSGNLSDADCRSRLYSSSELSMPLPTLPVFDETLVANGGALPPSGYGAGSTRPFLERPDVDGGFGDWSGWSACSRTCAGGEQYRTRPCNNPMPQNGGTSCIGDTVETRVCNDVTC